MRQVVDVRQLQVGNIILMAAYDSENTQNNDPAGWVFHTGRVIRVDTGRNVHGVTSLDSPGIDVEELTPELGRYAIHLATVRLGRHVDYNDGEWFVTLLQENGDVQVPVDDDSDDQPWPHRVDPTQELIFTWGQDLHR